MAKQAIHILMKIRPALILLFAIALMQFSCGNKNKNVSEQVLVTKPEEIDKKAEEVIQETVKEILRNKTFADSLKLKNLVLLDALYNTVSFKPLWSSDGKYNMHADSLFRFIESSKYYALFPDDYYYTQLKELRTLLTQDTVQQLDASKWAMSDLYLTSAFTQLINDLKVGRIVPDSVLKKDSTLTPDFYGQQLKRFREVQQPDSFAVALEPVHKEYKDLKEGVKRFADSASFKKYTYVHGYDSGTLRKLTYKRIREEDSINLEDVPFDSIALVSAIKKYQRLKKLAVNGKLSPDLIKKLNDTDWERFKRIAITLDRYKRLPAFPEQYIWVNVPSFRLQVKRGDSVLVTSKVAVGKTNTRTPDIVSAVSDMITYPQWTIPASIIEKEILPGLKRDAGYTSKRGYSIIDKDGNVVDPYYVDWSKYKKGIPYKVVQGSGDANALGVIKFNFPNKHSVYLHDTNQRHLFSRKNRALSHGCVRVEAWRDLAYFILERDSLSSQNFTPKDSLDSWLAAKQKKVIPVRNRLPVYIKYFTCEGVDGKVIFYEDIYDEDRKLRNKYLATK